MIKPKAAIFSDLHLGIYGNSENWHKTALQYIDWFVSELQLKKIKDVFFLGDFFHNRSEISVDTLSVASTILDKLKDFNVVFIIGNHDCFYKNRCDVHSLGIVRGYPNFTLVDKVYETTEFGKRLAFVPWNCELPDGKFDYIFGHFEIQNFKMNNFKVCDHGLTAMDFLSTKTDTVFSGHFHNRNTKKFNEGSIHYVGNTFGMDFADCENVKGYHILDVESGELEFVPNIVSPKFKKILASKIKSYTKEDFSNNIVKFLVDLDLDEKKVEKFEIYISKFKPWQLTTEYLVTSKLVDDVEEVDSIDLLDIFEEYIPQLKLEDAKKKRVDKLIKELYSANK